MGIISSILNCKKGNSNVVGIGNSPINEKFDTFSQLYYQNSSSNTIYEDLSSPKEKIDLFLALSDVSDALYTIHVLLSDDEFKTTKLIGKTNSKDGVGITFDTTMTIDYFFEKKQKIRFIVIKKDHTKSHSEEIILNAAVASIMGAKEQKLKLPLTDKSNSCLIVKGSTVKNNNLNLRIELLADSKDIGSCDLFYIIKRKVILDSSDLLKSGSIKQNIYAHTTTNDEELSNLTSPTEKLSKLNWVALYKSELSMEKEYDFIKFKETILPIHLITNSDNYRNSEILFELHDNRTKKQLGISVLTIDQLLTRNCSFLIKTETNYSSITLKANCSIEKKYRFLDYLRGGLQIALIVGIDFTASNRDLKNDYDLHRISNNELNAYERAIKSCASTVGYYDSDQLFPVFGYGGILPNENSVNHCFNVNLLHDPNVQFVDGILNSYRNAIRVVKLYGPTFFAPIIRKTIDICEHEKNNYVYHILMILTDGIINDMQQTIDELVVASFLPISVIIIGIGNNDFENMDVLDADTDPLISTKGVKAQRDLVQFVPFFKFQNDEKLLAEEVLEEIPFQVEEYFRINKQAPRDAIIDNY